MYIKLGNYSDFKSCIYSVYSPTSASDIREVESFYTALTNSVRPIPLAVMTIIMGDFNATLMKNTDSPFTPNSKQNRNGPLLEDFLEATDFKAVNTLFMKSTFNKLFSFYGPNCRRVTIDYILLRSKWVRSAQDCTAKNPVTIA